MRAPLLSLALGNCLIPASTAVLHASLSAALFSLRQVVISSALGMNALQSLSTSGVHAMRCSGVPCEKEEAGEAVADSKASDTHHCAKAVGRRSIQLFWLSMFIRGLAMHNRSPILDLIMADIDTLLPGACACSETSAFVAFDPAAVLPLPFEQIREAARCGRFRHQHLCAQTTKSSHVCPSVGNGTNANVSC